MSVQERKQRERAERERLIVATARELAEQQGWDAVTTRRLAERIEYSQPVLYSHFRGKREIIGARRRSRVRTGGNSGTPQGRFRRAAGVPRRGSRGRRRTGAVHRSVLGVPARGGDPDPVGTAAAGVHRAEARNAGGPARHGLTHRPSGQAARAFGPRHCLPACGIASAFAPTRARARHAPLPRLQQARRLLGCRRCIRERHRMGQPRTTAPRSFRRYTPPYQRSPGTEVFVSHRHARLTVHGRRPWVERVRSRSSRRGAEVSRSSRGRFLPQQSAFRSAIASSIQARVLTTRAGDFRVDHRADQRKMWAR